MYNFTRIQGAQLSKAPNVSESVDECFPHPPPDTLHPYLNSASPINISRCEALASGHDAQGGLPLAEWLINDNASLEERKHVVRVFLQHLGTLYAQQTYVTHLSFSSLIFSRERLGVVLHAGEIRPIADDDSFLLHLQEVAMVCDAVLPGLECRTWVHHRLSTERVLGPEFVSSILDRLIALEGHFPVPYMEDCELRHTALIKNLWPRTTAGEPLNNNEWRLLKVSMRLLPDILAVIAVGLDDDVRELTELLGCLAMESCHIIDDLFDAPAKATRKGFTDEQDILNTFQEIANKVIACYIADLDHRDEAATRFAELMDWFTAWVKIDSRLGKMEKVTGEERVNKCNGELYIRISNLVHSIEPFSDTSELMRVYGELAWILDDWRDVEIDREINHFNVFLQFEADVLKAFAYYTQLVKSRLAWIYQHVADEEKYSYLLLSLGLTDSELWKLMPEDMFEVEH